MPVFISRNQVNKCINMQWYCRLFMDPKFGVRLLLSFQHGMTRSRAINSIDRLSSLHGSFGSTCVARALFEPVRWAPHCCRDKLLLKRQRRANEVVICPSS